MEGGGVVWGRVPPALTCSRRQRPTREGHGGRCLGSSVTGIPGAALGALGSPPLSGPGLAVGQVPLPGDCQVCWALNPGLRGCHHPLPVLTMAGAGSCVVVYAVMGWEREPEERKPVLSSRNYRQTSGGLFARELGETPVLPPPLPRPSPKSRYIRAESLWMEMTRIIGLIFRVAHFETLPWMRISFQW